MKWHVAGSAVIGIGCSLAGQFRGVSLGSDGRSALSTDWSAFAS